MVLFRHAVVEFGTSPSCHPAAVRYADRARGMLHVRCQTLAGRRTGQGSHAGIYQNIAGLDTFYIQI